MVLQIFSVFNISLKWYNNYNKQPIRAPIVSMEPIHASSDAVIGAPSGDSEDLNLGVTGLVHPKEVPAASAAKFAKNKNINFDYFNRLLKFPEYFAYIHNSSFKILFEI